MSTRMQSLIQSREHHQGLQVGGEKRGEQSCKMKEKEHQWEAGDGFSSSLSHGG